MNEPNVLFALGLIVGAAALLVLATRRLRVPTIIVYIATGLLLGPATGLVEASPAVEALSEVGIALLLFLVGLELSFDKVRDVGKAAVAAGLAQVGFIFVVGTGIALGLGFGVMAAAFIATALTNSSTVLVVRLLDHKGETNEPYGHIVIGLNLVKDVVLIVVMAVMAGFGASGELGLGQVAGTLLLAAAGIAGLLGMSLLSARYALRHPFTWIAAMPDAMFVWSLTWCMLFAVGADSMGLSPAIGAFLAGVSLAQLGVAPDLRRRVNPLTSFFLAVFFVLVGTQMQVGAALALWPSLIVLTAFVLLAVPVFTMWVTARLGYDEQTSFLAGASMGQVSELSFIFAAVGLAGGMIGAPVVSLLTLIGLVSIGASAFMILFNGPLYAFCRRAALLRWLRAPAPSAAPSEPPLRGHVIVVGLNAMGRRIVENLVKQGEDVLAIDTDPQKLEGLPCRTLHGNAAYDSVLAEANLPTAKLLVSALQIEDANNLLAFRCRQLGVPSSIHAFDRSVIADLERAGAYHLIHSKSEGTKRIVEEMRSLGVLGR